MNADRQTALTLAKNLKRLMDHNELSQAELGRRSGVAQRTLSTLLGIDKPLEMNPTSTTIEQLAKYFGIPSWQLLVPDLPMELLTSPRFSRLIENYRDMGEPGREAVDRVAEAEVRYETVTRKAKAG